MKIIDTNKLNRFWKNGVKPIKDSVAQKLDTSKVINNLLTTKAGYALDARQGKVLQDQVSEINSNLSELNTGLAWMPIDFDAVITPIAPYATIVDAWPHYAYKCGNLMQLDFLLRVDQYAGGVDILRINEPYIPIGQVYILGNFPVVSNSTGTCNAWLGTGDYHAHTVYAINPKT